MKNKLIKKGLWGLYIDYPLHDTEIIDRSGIKLPLGHAGFALVDKNGNSEYYDYGRYKYRGVGKKRNGQYEGNFVRRQIPNKRSDESPYEYAQRVGEHLKNTLKEKRVTVSVVNLPNYDKAKEKLNEYLSDRSDYNPLTNLTCAGVAADIIREGRGIGGKVASFIGRVFSGSGWVPGGLLPSNQRPAWPSATIKLKRGGLIPKAGLGDTLKRGAKKVINFVSRHSAPSREQTMFEVQNQQRIEGLKPRTLQDLQVDLKNLGYYTMTPDNKMGRGTRSAIQLAEADGYKIDMNNFTITKGSSKKLLKKESKKYTSIEKSDMKEFGKWLYNKGLETNPLGNISTTTSHMLLNLVPVYAGRGDMPFMDFDPHYVASPGLSKGTKLQALGLYFYLGGANSVTKNGEKRRRIGTDNRGRYEWQKINGGRDVNSKDQSLLEKTKNSAQFTLGLFEVLERDGKYHIMDTYNFNPQSEAETKRRASQKDASSYDKVRLMALSGVNNNIVIDSSISNKEVLKYYNLFKNEQQ